MNSTIGSFTSTLNPAGQMPITAVLERDGFSFPIISAVMTEAVCRSHEAAIFLHAAAPCSSADFINRIWKISIKDALGNQRYWVGECIFFDQMMLDTGRWVVKCKLESLLSRLRKSTVHFRTYGATSVKDWVKNMLNVHQIGAENLVWRFDCKSVRPYVIQALQSDYDFFLKMLAQENIVILPSTDSLHFYFLNGPSQLSDSPIHHLFYKEKAELLQNGSETLGAFVCSETSRGIITEKECWIKNKHWEDQSPLQLYSGVPCAWAGKFEAGAMMEPFSAFGYDDASINAYLKSLNWNAKGKIYHHLEVESNAILLQTGNWLDISDMTAHRTYKGHIRYVQHILTQFGKTLRYQNKAILQTGDGPWRAVSPPRVMLPLVMQAFVEGNKETGEPALNERGEEKIIFPDNANFTASAIYMPRLRSYVAPQGGFHFPLEDGVEVLVSFLYGETDLPIIVNALTNDAMAGPVTSANPYQHIIRSRSGHELCFDDEPGKQSISLQSSPTHGIRLENGPKKGITLQSDGDFHMSIAKNFNFNVGKDWVHKSGKGTILSAGKSQRFKARKGNIDLNSAGVIEIDTQKNMNVDVAGDVFVKNRNFSANISGKYARTVKDGNITYAVRNNIEMMVEKKINWKSDEKILLMAGGGKAYLKMEKDKTTLFGAKSVLIEAEEVEFGEKASFLSRSKQEGKSKIKEPLESSYFNSENEHLSTLINQGKDLYNQVKQSADKMVANMAGNEDTAAETSEEKPLIFHQIVYSEPIDFYNKKSMPGELTNLFFCISPEKCYVEKFIDRVYANPTKEDREYFKKVNRHVSSWIEPGQMVFILPRENKVVEKWGEVLYQSGMKVNNMMCHIPAEEAAYFAEHFALYGSFAGTVGDKRGSYRSDDTEAFKKGFGIITETADALLTGFKQDLESYMKALSEHPFSKELAKFRMEAVESMDRRAVTAIDYLIKGKKISTSNILEAWLQSGLIIHHWIPTTWKLAPLDELYASVSKMHHVSKTGGIALIALDFHETQEKINKICKDLNVKECRKMEIEEWGSFVGKVAVGSGAGAAVEWGTAKLFFKILPKTGHTAVALAAVVLALIVVESVEEPVDKIFREKIIKTYELIYEKES